MQHRSIACSPGPVDSPRGAKLALVNDGPFPNVIANGIWDGGMAKPEREPGAPPVDNVEVHSAGEVVEIGSFTSVGSYSFFCPIHSGMNLTVIVE